MRLQLFILLATVRLSGQECIFPLPSFENFTDEDVKTLVDNFDAACLYYGWLNRIGSNEPGSSPGWLQWQVAKRKPKPAIVTDESLPDKSLPVATAEFNRGIWREPSAKLPEKRFRPLPDRLNPPFAVESKISTSRAASEPIVWKINKHEFAASTSYRSKTKFLGSWGEVGHYGIPNRTRSFKALARQVAKIPGRKKGHIDWHWNSGGGSGPEAIGNSGSEKFARAWLRRIHKIYDRNGWVYDRDHPFKKSYSLGVPNQGRKVGLQAFIAEFCFADDRQNGSAPFLYALSSEGQLEIAKATLAAAKECGLDSCGHSIGHNGSRGTSGDTHKGLHERVYAIGQIQAIDILTSR